MKNFSRSLSSVIPNRRMSESRLTSDDFIKPKQHDEHLEDDSYRRCVKAALNHGFVEVFMGCVILVNFIVICIETDAEAADAPSLPWAGIVGFICFIVYVIEWLLHGYVDGLRVFLSVSADFDLIIIIFGATEYILGLTSGSNTAGILRLLRLLRLLRVIKLFRALKDLRTLLQMLASCARTLMWSFVLCFIVLTIWSVAAVQILHGIVQEIDAEFGYGDCERCGRAFASVMASNLTFAQIILAGDSWGVLAIPTIEHSPHTVVFFVGVLVTLMFGILNLVVAGVVDTFAETRSNNVNMIANDLELNEAEERRELNAIFQEIDNDEDGEVSFHDVVQGAEQASGMRNWLRALDIGRADLRELFDLMDEDHDGQVCATEFAGALYRLKHSETKITAKVSKIILQSVEMKADAIMNGLQELLALQANFGDCTPKTPRTPKTSKTSAKTERPRKCPSSESMCRSSHDDGSGCGRCASISCTSASQRQGFLDKNESSEDVAKTSVESVSQLVTNKDEGNIMLLDADLPCRPDHSET
eukprot:TRINITY_DN9931_c0_g1_i1.p1 TRINITY_DN9931_c0_g1~~TRINITY_DN9931_c0_g1_i1.p1  ORF type:complete len:532 (+),score=72.83 TRINITY_DN9931_c0_g1_i1:90-1685(+)